MQWARLHIGRPCRLAGCLSCKQSPSPQPGDTIATRFTEITHTWRPKELTQGKSSLLVLTIKNIISVQCQSIWAELKFICFSVNLGNCCWNCCIWNMINTVHIKWFKTSVSYYMKTESMWPLWLTGWLTVLRKTPDTIVETVIVLHTSLSIKCLTSKCSLSVALSHPFGFCLRLLLPHGNLHLHCKWANKNCHHDQGCLNSSQLHWLE